MRFLSVVLLCCLGFAATAGGGNYYCKLAHSGAASAAASEIDTRSDSVDILHTAIHLNLSDFVAKELQGFTRLTIEAKVDGITQLNVDLLELTVDSVTSIGGVHNSFTYNDTLVSIDLLSTLNTGDTTSVKVWYHGAPLQYPGDWGGFYWNNTYAYNIGVSFLGNPHNYGRVWFPCFDNFVERSLYDFHITTDDTRKAFCGGLLQSETDNGDGTISWHWKLGQEIPSYLASVAVSDYTSIDYTHYGIAGPIPVRLAARPGDTTDLRGSFSNLPNAIDAYEEAYGPYHFDRVGYCVTPFSAGAMEHACNITYMSAAVDGSLTWETLMAHELSHHWWGDLVTCSSQEDMWLNEGMASYSEYIFLEYVYGRGEYTQSMIENLESVLQFAHVSDDGYRAVSGVSFEHTYSTTVYDKGAAVAHSMRAYLGDTNFFGCLDDFLQANKFTDISSEELRDYLTSCSGTDMTDFFADWVFAPGFPHFSIDRWVAESAATPEYLVKVNINQKLNHAPHYYSNVPLEITCLDDQGNKFTEQVMVSGECTYVEFNCPFEPDFVTLDYYNKLSDAITAEKQTIGSTGTVDFGVAKARLTVNNVTDSAFVRIEHNWVAPDALQTPVNGLHLSDYRYWKVDGILSTGFEADMRLDYNGSTSLSNGYLDNGLFTNSEDSLVVMYRAKATDDWGFWPDFDLNVLGSTTNGIGNVVVNDITLGEYCLAIWDHNRPDTSVYRENCVVLGYDNGPTSQGLFVYPNPAEDVVRLEYHMHPATYLQVFNMQGKQIMQKQLVVGEGMTEISVEGWLAGSYVISLFDGNGILAHEKFIVQ